MFTLKNICIYIKNITQTTNKQNVPTCLIKKNIISALYLTPYVTGNVKIICAFITFDNNKTYILVTGEISTKPLLRQSLYTYSNMALYHDSATYL